MMNINVNLFQLFINFLIKKVLMEELKMTKSQTKT